MTSPHDALPISSSYGDLIWFLSVNSAQNYKACAKRIALLSAMSSASGSGSGGVRSTAGGYVSGKGYSGSSAESRTAASSSGGDSSVVRQILQDILELGRLPKELSKRNTESDVAEYKLAIRMRKHDLGARAEHELTTFFKRHLKAF